MITGSWKLDCGFTSRQQWASGCRGPERRDWPRAGLGWRPGVFLLWGWLSGCPNPFMLDEAEKYRCYWNLCVRKLVAAVLLCTLFWRIKHFSGCLLKMFERKDRGKALVTLMGQCYKCNWKPDLTSQCKYPFSFSFFFNLFNENEKVKPKFLHSLISQNEYSS